MRLILVLLFLLAACDRSDASSASSSGRAAIEPAEVPRREQEAGLARCGDMLSRMDGPGAAPSFARLMRECSGLFARRRCRDALAADTFSRDRVATECRAAYCDGARRASGFCTTEMPTDADFIEQFASFSRSRLRRDLRRVMDRDGANEIADLFADLIEAQASRQ